MDLESYILIQAFEAGIGRTAARREIDVGKRGTIQRAEAVISSGSRGLTRAPREFIEQ
jgi:outer membrane biosynthesis protein TonB